MSARRSRRRSAVLLLALLAGLGVVASACAGGGHGQLLLAEDTTVSPDQASAPTSTDIWAVDPGDEPDDDALVATDVTSPLYINDVQEDGSIARQLLASQWGGEVLASFAADGGGATYATVGTPGEDAVQIAESDSQVQTNILRRGVYVATTDGCTLARSADDIDEVGKGLCQVSEDERWVVSWPADGGELTIRDLRSGDTRTVEGDTIGAVALGAGSRVLAVQRTDEGSQGVVIDATDGDVVGRTDTYGDLQAMPVEPGSTGFVALTASRSEQGTVDGTQLLWIGTDAKVRVIDRGALMLPVRTGSDVTYVHFGDAEDDDSIRRWDSGSGERETLLGGKVGAASVGDGRIVATKDTDEGVELYRSDDRGDLVHATTAPGDASAGSSVSRVITQGDTALVQLTFGGTASLARVDLSGDDSDVPVKHWTSMLLEGVDTDGTVLITGAESDDAEQESIGVVTPSSDAFVERTTADSTGLNMIHEGVIYVTDRDADGDLTIRTVRAQGDVDGETLYTGYQLAGSTWPTDNGATQSTLISRVAVISQQQQQQQQQAQGAQGGATPGG
ncbi:hypothetical protein [Dermatobacter hominis]|uniref:hypothetical protein n=1 Tax=Dermatobacter hominis TaxID=2884263 RepID=UPI001D11C946|nr:hypothetical protein [Dermatobacter hominis]UDY37971.1 hypothetical protein LH044_10600 [Dermatobacter hominis]